MKVSSGRWIVRDGEKPGEGQPVGFVHAMPTGMIQIKIDGYLTPNSAAVARVLMLAAINYVKG